MTSSAKNKLLIVPILLLLFVIFSAARIGTANLFSISANSRMEGWKSADIYPTEVQIDSVFQQFKFAEILNGYDPTVHENLARVHLVHASNPEATPDVRQTHLVAGLTEARTALRLRPISPYSWTILLSIKRELGEFDAEFRFALHRAIELGPWEPDLLIGLADIGLSAWSSLPTQEQSMIQQVFVRGMERQSLILRELAELHRRACTEQGRACP